MVALLLAGCTHPPIVAHTPPFQRNMLTNLEYPSLEILTYYMEGNAPLPEALETLASRIKELTAKQEVILDPPLQLPWTSVKGRDWTRDRSLDTDDIPRKRSDHILYLRVFYLDGKVGDTSYGQAAGAYGFDQITIYPETFRDRPFVSVGPVRVPYSDAAERNLVYETEVLLHEAGHAMGLVNNGIPMVHSHVDASEPCRCHSSNTRSIMFSGLDSIPLDSLVDPREIPRHDFDADDLADIKAFQDAARAEASTR